LNKENTRIVFMGTPEFAVASLKALYDNNYTIAAVVTSPDKPAGRGLKLQQSAVKRFASENNIPVLQPQKLTDPEFIAELKLINAELFIVVAFRMLPAVVWKLPNLGTFNLHASLLPQYRGAAPINHAIINGEDKTGVTTFFINESIDTGSILFSEEVEISPIESAGELHDKLMEKGSNLVCRTVDAIISGNVQPVTQDTFVVNAALNPAPKIFKEFCRIDWKKDTDAVFNLIRGLSPYPGAYTELEAPDGRHFSIKIYKTEKVLKNHAYSPGSILTDGKTHLSIATTDGLLNIQEIQASGKVRMLISEFLRGFQINQEWKAIMI
jgi:methionyl-tRNA formyltransferase